jgi:hypothetical protein
LIDDNIEDETATVEEDLGGFKEESNMPSINPAKVVQWRSEQIRAAKTMQILVKHKKLVGPAENAALSIGGARGSAKPLAKAKKGLLDKHLAELLKNPAIKRICSLLKDIDATEEDASPATAIDFPLDTQAAADSKLQGIAVCAQLMILAEETAAKEEVDVAKEEKPAAPSPPNVAPASPADENRTHMCLVAERHSSNAAFDDCFSAGRTTRELFYNYWYNDTESNALYNRGLLTGPMIPPGYLSSDISYSFTTGDRTRGANDVELCDMAKTPLTSNSLFLTEASLLYINGPLSDFRRARQSGLQTLRSLQDHTGPNPRYKRSETLKPGNAASLCKEETYLRWAELLAIRHKIHEMNKSFISNRPRRIQSGVNISLAEVLVSGISAMLELYKKDGVTPQNSVACIHGRRPDRIVNDGVVQAFIHSDTKFVFLGDSDCCYGVDGAPCMDPSVFRGTGRTMLEWIKVSQCPVEWFIYL